MASKEIANFNFALVSTNVVRRVSPFLAEYKPGQMNPGLILHGDVGRGKTHLMAAIVRSLMLTHGISARFVEFSHLLADLKSNFGRGEGAAALIEPLVKVDILAIDELGKGRNTEFEGTVLDELVSRRYNAGRTIIATTNYAPGNPQGVATPEFTTGKRPALIDRVGDRVYSRLLEMCHLVHIDGGDYRQKIAEQRYSGPTGMRK
jgi:DNA replication protein DnaC